MSEGELLSLENAIRKPNQLQSPEWMRTCESALEESVVNCAIGRKKTIVIIGMFANKIYTSRHADDKFRFGVKIG
jgi:hypothetical protein